MPNTRASTRRQVSKRGFGRKEHAVTSSDDLKNGMKRPHREGIETGAEVSVMDHLREARLGVEELSNRIQSLEQENEDMRCELRQAQQNVDNGPRRKTSRRKIQSLERTIINLRATQEKDRRTIEKLRETEVQQDVKELADDLDGSVTTQQTRDLGEDAIKLLRSVCETIDMNTLAEGEECAICMEEMTVEKCYSLPCRHPVCVGCFQQLGDGSNTVYSRQAESVQCPHCREICPREECEIITHTAVQQWDVLLEISQKWAIMDTGEMDTGIDDGEGNFIDCSSVAATVSPCATETLGEAVDLDSEASAASTSPNDAGTVAYKSLPSPLKRKRLSELVAQRMVKQRV